MNKEIMSASKGHTVYKTADGLRVPSVTTVLGVIAKPALIAWANKQGLEGIDTTRYVEQAATVGTVAHYMIHCDIIGVKPDLDMYAPALVKIAENSYLKYLDWRKPRKIEPIMSEAAFVSEKYRFGGTIDLYIMLDGEPVLLDIKTSDSGIWDEMRHQVSAYRALLMEKEMPVAAAYILRIGKTESNTFQFERLDNLDTHFELFLHALEIYRLQNMIKKGVSA